MALSPIQTVTERKQGKGGLVGKIAGTGIGAIAGGIAGFYAGNPYGGAVAGAGLGGAAGGAIGNAVDPSKVVESDTVPLSRMENKPEIQLANLQDSQKALMETNHFTMPEKEELNQTVYAPTIAKLKQQMGVA